MATASKKAQQATAKAKAEGKPTTFRVGVGRVVDFDGDRYAAGEDIDIDDPLVSGPLLECGAIEAIRAT